jgi:hypothetical protein
VENVTHATQYLSMSAQYAAKELEEGEEKLLVII